MKEDGRDACVPNESLANTQMARKMKGGFGGDSMALPMILSILALAAVVAFFVMVPVKKEGFVPVAPSKEGDKKDVTPAGNVILY